jgi:hypothetical protein
MATEIPPWLQPPDIAGQYAHGLQLGVSLAQEQQRLAAEEHRTQMEAQVRQQSLQHETLMQQARLQTETAYHAAELGMQRDRLNQAAQATEARTAHAGAVLAQRTKIQDARAAAAAAKMADQDGFAKDLAVGMPVEQALYRHPHLTTPAAAIQAHKAAQDTTGERLELSKRRLDLQERVLKARENRPGKIGSMDIPLPAGPGELSGPMLKGVPLDSALINQVMGTNAPAGTGTNFSARAQSPAAAGNATPAAQPAAESPFQEGAIVRHKKTGQQYMIVDGEPMPLEGEQ